MQESSGIIVLNKNNNILILLPSGDSTKKSWSVPKGKIEVGEDPNDAAVRELEEETNIRVDKSKLIPIGFKIYKNRKKKVHLFLVKLEKIDDSFLPYLDWENEKHLWISPEKAAKLVHEAQIEFLLKLQKLIDS